MSRKEGSMTMVDGQHVEVLLSDDTWHRGVVIKARKMWVQLDQSSTEYPFIADESCIKEWRLVV
jgi:hypothetical protein